LATNAGARRFGLHGLRHLYSSLLDGAAKPELLEAAQHELMKHHWDTFCTEPLTIAEGGKGVIVPGCVHCRKLLYTDNQYLRHLALDVLPKIIEKAIGETLSHSFVVRNEKGEPVV
jgi:hypothetical protein